MFAMDDALPGDAPITLVIKAPNQRMADHTVECMLGWTIRKLKEHLETVYPSKPKHNEQRLIYSGKLLQDHLTLKEILRQFEGCEEPNRHTVHLVCSTSSDSSSSSASKSASEKKKSASPEPSPLSQSSRGPGSAGPGASLPSTPGPAGQPDGLRYRGVPTHQAAASTTNGFNPALMYAAQQPGMMGGYPAMYASAPGSAYSAAPTGYTQQQYAWMAHQQQQAYSQYMMQYMQYYQSMYYPGQTLDPQAMSSATYMQQQQVSPDVQQQQQQQQQPQAPAAAAAAAGRPNNNNLPRMNAQGGVEQEDEDDLEPRDWLHHVYSLMRCLTFLGILFFYSNLTRFLLVSSGTIAIYFLQKIRRHMQRQQQARDQERQQQQQAEQQQQQQQQQAEQQQQQGAAAGENNGDPSGVNPGNREEEQQPQQQENANNAEAGADATPAATPAATEGQPEQPPPEEEGHWVTRAVLFVCMFFQTFFTSLLPTPPELLEAAN